MGWQSRFRWIVSPGNDVYVVYTHKLAEEPLFNRFSTLDKRFASKILYITVLAAGDSSHMPCSFGNLRFLV